MSLLDALRTLLDDAGWPVEHATEDGAETLAVAFGPGAAGAERTLFIEPVARLATDSADDAEALAFTLIHPVVFDDMDALTGTIRLLLALNRMLPIGAHQFSEAPPGVAFAYTLLVDDLSAPPRRAVLDAVGMIDRFTAEHGALIARVAHGEAMADDVLDALATSGLRPLPVLGRSATAGS